MTTAQPHSLRPGFSTCSGSARLTLLMLAATMSACSFMSAQDSAPDANHIDISSIPNAKPKPEPLSQRGNPNSYVVGGKRYVVMHSSHDYHARGIASWYGTKFHGRHTANGEIYDMYKMTAAHKTLPLPSYVRVTNLDNGRQVVVRVNDRGPFHGKRLIDLSYVAARKLGMTGNGTAHVDIEAIDPTESASRNSAAAAPQPVDTTTSHAAQLKPQRPAMIVTATPAPGTSTSTSTSTSTQYYLQLGAFTQRHNAEQLLTKLLQHTVQPVHITRNDNPDTPFYRVRVGPYPSRAVTRDIESQLSALGFGGAHIVADGH